MDTLHSPEPTNDPVVQTNVSNQAATAMNSFKTYCQYTVVKQNRERWLTTFWRDWLDASSFVAAAAFGYELVLRIRS